MGRGLGQRSGDEMNLVYIDLNYLSEEEYEGRCRWLCASCNKPARLLT